MADIFNDLPEIWTADALVQDMNNGDTFFANRVNKIWAALDRVNERFSKTEKNFFEFGAIGDGSTANLAAWEAVIDEANSSGSLSLRVVAGVYRISVASTKTLTGKLRLILEPDAVLDFTGTTVDVLSVRNSLDVNGGGEIRGWSDAAANLKLFDITETPTSIPYLRLLNIEFDTSPDGWVLFSDRNKSGGGDSLGYDRLVVRGCFFHDIAWGLQIDSIGAKRSWVVQNTFEDIEENAVWLGRDKGGGTISEYTGQGRFWVEDNYFKDIGDGSVQSSPDRHAVIVFGMFAQVHGNVIEGLDNDTHSDCEGIYTKVLGCSIMYNKLRNGGRGQAAIAVKGTERGGALASVGYEVIVARNVIIADSGYVDASAISLGDGGEVTCDNNYIDGMTDTPIVVGGADQKHVFVRANRIYNTLANVGISLASPTAMVYVENNYIENLDGTGLGSGNAVGIQATNAGVDPYKLLRLRLNTVKNITGDGSIVSCYLDNMTQNPAVDDYEIIENIFDTTVNCIHFAHATPRYLRLRVEGNRFLNFSGTHVFGLANLLTTRTRFYRNVGFLSENQGIATFDGVSGDIVVTHGCDWTKRLDRRVTLTPLANDPGGRLLLVDAADDTFTIRCNGATPTAGRQVAWVVHPHDEVYS